jgi:Cu/Ag efflux protein CusF
MIMKRAPWITGGFVAVLLGVALALPTAEARADAADPCCAVTGTDVASGVVTAKESVTGKTYQFKVTDTALLTTLNVGDKVAADFDTQKVRIHGLGSELCCAIVTPLQAAPGLRPSGPPKQVR